MKIGPSLPSLPPSSPPPENIFGRAFNDLNNRTRENCITFFSLSLPSLFRFVFLAIRTSLFGYFHRPFFSSLRFIIIFSFRLAHLFVHAFAVSFFSFSLFLLFPFSPSPPCLQLPFPTETIYSPFLFSFFFFVFYFSTEFWQARLTFGNIFEEIYRAHTANHVSEL